MALDDRVATRFRRGLDPSLDHVSLREQASGLLRAELGFDLAVWAVLDPATLMWTSCVLDGMERDEALENAVFDNEYGQPDVLKLVDLADGGLAGALTLATGGDPDTSRRYREVLAPRGLADEARLVFSDGASSWGALCLYRSGGRFSEQELGTLRPLARPFATALRTALLRADHGAGVPVPGHRPTTGLILAGADGRVIDVNDDARALLGVEGLEEVPQAVQSVIARRAAGLPATTTAPTRDGRWLAFHATPLGASLAVVVEDVRPHQLADLVVRSRGLSPREREVLERVARGRSNRQTARELGLSEYTVQDHLKSVFTKFGVTSRTELVASLFFDHYAPMHVADAST